MNINIFDAILNIGHEIVTIIEMMQEGKKQKEEEN